MKTADVDMESRLEGIRDVCCNLAAERASKAVMSAQVITELRERIRGAISDYEMGVEPGSEGSAVVTPEEDDEEEEGSAAATPGEDNEEKKGPAEQTEVAPQI
jgi:hypothetical protein